LDINHVRFINSQTCDNLQLSGVCNGRRFPVFH